MQQYLVHDVAALNKLEMLIGDLWGLAYVEPGASPTDDETTVLDEAARLTQVDDLSVLRYFYETHPGLWVPEVFPSFSLTHEWRKVSFKKD